MPVPRLDWLLSPLAIYAAIALGLGCCIFLFLVMNCGLTTAEKRLKSEIRLLEEALAEIRRKLAELECAGTDVACASAVPRASVNLAKRTQVIRMHRRGESAAAISAALELAPAEVELILKVQKIVLNGNGPAGEDGVVATGPHASRAVGAQGM